MEIFMQALYLNHLQFFNVVLYLCVLKTAA